MVSSAPLVATVIAVIFDRAAAGELGIDSITSISAGVIVYQTAGDFICALDIDASADDKHAVIAGIELAAFKDELFEIHDAIDGAVGWLLETNFSDRCVGGGIDVPYAISIDGQQIAREGGDDRVDWTAQSRSKISGSRWEQFIGAAGLAGGGSGGGKIITPIVRSDRDVPIRVGRLLNRHGDVLGRTCIYDNQGGNAAGDRAVRVGCDGDVVGGVREVNIRNGQRRGGSTRKLSAIGEISVNATAACASLPLVGEWSSADGLCGKLRGLALVQIGRKRLHANRGRESRNSGASRIESEQLALGKSLFENGDVIDGAAETACSVAPIGRVIANDSRSFERLNDVIVRMRRGRDASGIEHVNGCIGRRHHYRDERPLARRWDQAGVPSVGGLLVVPDVAEISCAVINQACCCASTSADDETGVVRLGATRVDPGSNGDRIGVQIPWQQSCPGTA